jgi:hypothetical protein
MRTSVVSLSVLAFLAICLGVLRFVPAVSLPAASNFEYLGYFAAWERRQGHQSEAGFCLHHPG